MRIHRDTRFAKDKTPYKDHLDLWFWSGKKKSSTERGCTPAGKPRIRGELSSPRIVDVIARHYAAVSPLHEWLLEM